MKKIFFIVVALLWCSVSFGQKYYNKTESDIKYATKVENGAKVDTVDLVNPWPEIRDTITSRLNNTPLTGIPTAPTATLGTATTQLATMAALDEAMKKSGVMRRIYQNNVQVSHTGTTAETTILTFTIQGNEIGANGSFHILPLYSAIGVTGNKTLRIRFNGTTMSTVVLATTNISGQFYYILRNRNNTASQVQGYSSTATGAKFIESSNIVSTRTIDITQPITVTITAENTVPTETSGVEAIEVYASY